MKSVEDKVVDALVEIGRRPQAGVFEVMGICLQHFGDNVSRIELSKKVKVNEIMLKRNIDRK